MIIKRSSSIYKKRKMQIKKEKGFTIIELLVVVAIIAVLAAIVLVNVTQYIAKGRDAAIRGNMSTILVNSAVFFDDNNTYVGFVTGAGCNAGNSGFTGPRTAITAAGGTISCPASTLNGFCTRTTLNDGTDFCVDGSGYKGAPTAATDCAGADLTCL